MTYDHETARIHQAELDREIDGLRTERILAGDRPQALGLLARARRRTGRALIAAGHTLAGTEARPLGTHRV
jgi:hypothetical protein